MMKYSEEGETLKDKSTCARLRAALKMCLLESECCQVHHKTPRECLSVHDETVPENCHLLRTSFFECKRSIIDGRRRFRGPKGEPMEK